MRRKLLTGLTKDETGERPSGRRAERAEMRHNAMPDIDEDAVSTPSRKEKDWFSG